MAEGFESDYNIVIASRTPNESTAPTIVELGEVNPVGSISYADEISAEGEASFSLEPNEVPEDIASRLKNLRATPCECSIYRKGHKVWNGTLLSCQLQGPTLTINSRGLFYYARYMTLESDLSFSNQDQYTIGKNLIDSYQSLDYGNYGIITSGIGSSGTNRTRNYNYVERHIVYDRLVELSELDGGFEFYMNFDRELVFVPQMGSDKTNTVYADDNNIIDPVVFWSVAADDVASEGIAASAIDDVDQDASVGIASNSVVRESFGRATVFRTIDGVTGQATIDGYAQKIVDERQEQVLSPNPQIGIVEGTEPLDYGPGDLITYQYQVGTLGIIDVERRIRFRRITAEDDGSEHATWELV